MMFSCLSVSGLEVVQDGKANCLIILSPMASPSAQLAAEELIAYLKKMSGAELAIRTELPGKRSHHQPLVRHESEFTWSVDENKPSASTWEMVPAAADTIQIATSGAIVIGTIDSLTPIPRQVKKRLAECDNEEAFYIKSEDDNVFIIGKNPIGALYGTYTLLETYLGVHWFHPGELGEHCPKLATITLAKIDDFQKPDLATRYLRGGSGPYHVYDTAIWCVRNKMQTRNIQAHRWFEPGQCTKERAEFLALALNAVGDSRGGHLIWGQTVPDELFEKHPEYFPMKNGKRERGTSSANSMQRCVSNPEVVKLVAEYVLDWCNADPKNSFTLDASDSRDTWCDCEECKKIGTVDGKFKITNLYHHFASQVTDYVLKHNPEAQLNIYFYIDKCYPPDDKSIHYDGKNFRGLYCTCWPYARCYAHQLSNPDCVQNQKCLANMREILKVCPRLYTYEYLCNSNIEYVPVWKTTAQDIKDLAAIGFEGYMDIVHAYKWRPRWLSIYLGAKLHWNIKLDPEVVRDEAYASYYGAAAPAMKKYHDLRLKLWENAPGHAFYGGPKRQAYCLTVPGAEKELREYLSESKKLAGKDNKVLTRINLDEEFLQKYWKVPAEEMAKRFSAEKQILPQRSTEKIVIDGDLSEETWVAARPVGGFLTLNTDQPPSQENSFRVAYDDDNLYIGFVAMNNKAWSEETAKMLKRDSTEIWSDDHIELQFSPPNPDGQFYHICINTRGVFYDSMMIGSNSDLSYDSQAEIKVKKLSDRFVYEIRLPLASMRGDVSAGNVWGMYALRRSCNLQPPVTTETCSLDGNYPHRVMEFRQITFGKDVVKNGNFSDVEEKKKGTLE